LGYATYDQYYGPDERSRAATAARTPAAKQRPKTSPARESSEAPQAIPASGDAPSSNGHVGEHSEVEKQEAGQIDEA
ncbi:MAG TPA: hypothetical protein VIT64_12570, partial [Ilumatobacteraceae bacterium]